MDVLKERCEKNYGGAGMIPLIVFLGLCIGAGIIFSIQGLEKPFGILDRNAPLLIGLLVALLIFDRKESIARKTQLFCAYAGQSSPMQLTLILLLSGGFTNLAAEIGGKESVANLAISLIPTSFMVPAIFVLAAVMSTCIGTSNGTLAAILPIGVAMCQGTGVNMAIVGAAVICGAYFGDNLSLISDTTIVATQSVGAQMKDKFRMNLAMSLPAGIMATIAFYIASRGSINGSSLAEAGAYNLMTILPYLAVLVMAIAGLDIILVMTLGIVLAAVIGMVNGTALIDCMNAVSTGMSNMMTYCIFAMLIAALVGFVRYYGGIDWLMGKLTKLVKGKRSCEYICCNLPMVLSAIIAHGTMAIMISGPLVKEMGDRHGIEPKRMAGLMDIGGCLGVTFIPHASGMLLAIGATGAEYFDIVPYLYYTMFLLVAVVIVVQFRLLTTKKKEQAA